MKKNNNVTVKDVANLANVAPSTVSLVLNNSPKVTEKTRKKVLKAIKELNYIPNNFAVSLRQKIAICVGIILPDLHNSFYLDIVEGIKYKCDMENIPVYIVETKHCLEEEKHQIQMLRGVKVNRYVFIGTNQDEHLIEPLLDLYTVIYIDKCDSTDKIPYIMIDNYKSSYDACSYLINKECKNIYYISQSVLTKPLINRKNGIIDALKDNDLPYSNKVINTNEVCFSKMEAGYLAMKYILEIDQPDAIIATSDLVAIGALRFIHEKGLKVPADISIIGFDNIEISKYCIPTLTTISQPMKQMGELAFSLMMNKRDNQQSANCFVLKHEFIIRESTR